MELREFVKETLIQVTSGVKEAQEECLKHGGLVNPMLENPLSNDVVFKVADKYYPATMVKYRIGLSETIGNESARGIGVSLSIVSVGVRDKKETENQSTTSMEFSVNVVFPYIDRKGNHVPIDRIL